MIDWYKRAEYSGIKVGRRKKYDIPGGGVPVHTSDVLDFAGIHLSSFERYYNHLNKKSINKRERKIQEIQVLLSPSIRKLQDMHVHGIEDKAFKNSYGQDTLVVIPYFAQKQWRTAESILQNRPLYLNATYFSLVSHFSKFAIAVQNEEDKKFAEEESGLLLHAVLHLKINARGYTKLPVAALQEVTRLALTGNKIMQNIKYIFYCEADMMYTMRSMNTLMHSLNHESFVLFPHRLMTYLPGHLNHIDKKIELSNIKGGNESDLDPYFSLETSAFMSFINKSQQGEEATEKEGGMQGQKREGSKYSCCSDLLNCTTRSHWHGLSSEGVRVNRLFGLPVVIATSHDPFEGGKFRVCNITEGHQCQGVSIGHLSKRVVS